MSDSAIPTQDLAIPTQDLAIPGTHQLPAGVAPPNDEEDEPYKTFSLIYDNLDCANAAKFASYVNDIVWSPDAYNDAKTLVPPNCIEQYAAIAAYVRDARTEDYRVIFHFDTPLLSQYLFSKIAERIRAEPPEQKKEAIRLMKDKILNSLEDIEDWDELNFHREQARVAMQLDDDSADAFLS
jgi:hypothetical protein